MQPDTGDLPTAPPDSAPTDAAAVRAGEPFTGRNSELQALLRGIRAGATGHGSVWIVSGPSGIGKSSLVGRMERLAREEGFEVRTGYCMEGVPAPYFLWNQVFPLVLEGAVSRSAPMTRWDLPSLGGATRPKRDSKGETTFGAASIDRALLGYLAHARTACAERPVAIFIEDLQWADPASVETLAFLGRNAAHLKLVIVATLRSETDGPPMGGGTPAWGPIVDLRHRGLLRWLHLGPLDERSTRELVTRVLGRVVLARDPEAWVQRAIRESGGNPLYAIQIATSGFPRVGPPERRGPYPVAFGPDADSDEDIPSTVRESVLARFATLTLRQQALLRSAAIVGRDFPLACLPHSLGLTAGETRVVASELEGARWLVRSGAASASRWEFVPGLSWRIVRDSLGAEELRRGASDLAEWWANQRPGEIGVRIQLLRDAGRRPEALQLAHRAVRQSIARETYGLLAKYLPEIADLTPAGADRSYSVGVTYLEAVDAVRWNASLDSARSLVNELCRLDLDAPLRWVAELWQGELHIGASNVDVDATLRRIEAEVRSSPLRKDPELQGRIRFLRALLDQYALPPSEQLVLGRRALRALHGRGLSLERARIWVVLGCAHLQLAEPQRARRMLDAAVREVRGRPKLPVRLEMLLIGLRAGIQDLEGELGEARSSFLELARQCRAVGAAAHEGWALINLAGLEADVGLREEAWQHALEARKIGQRLDHRVIEATANLVLASVQLSRGRATEAKGRLRAARGVLSAAGPSVHEWYAQLLDLRRAMEAERRPARPGEMERLESRLGSLPVACRSELALLQARSAELGCDLGASRDAAEKAIEYAVRSGASRMELGALAYRAQWEKAHGGESGAQQWESRLRELVGRLGLNPQVAGALLAPKRDGAHDAPRGIPDPRAAFPPRILRHLLDVRAVVGGPFDADVIPATFTPPGMSTALNAPRTSFARALGRLEQRGLVLRVRRRVRGSHRLGHAFFLTELGRQAAESLIRPESGDLAERPSHLPRAKGSDERAGDNFR